MYTSRISSGEVRLKMYDIQTKFGHYGYVMARNKEEAERVAKPYLPLSECRADWFSVNEVHGLELIES